METDKKENKKCKKEKEKNYKIINIGVGKARLYLQLDVLRLQYHPFKLHIKDS